MVAFLRGKHSHKKQGQKDGNVATLSKPTTKITKEQESPKTNNKEKVMKDRTSTKQGSNKKRGQQKRLGNRSSNNKNISSTKKEERQSYHVHDDDSIGDELALHDQFVLYIPQKHPVGILKNNVTRTRSSKGTGRQRCIRLQGMNLKHLETAAEDNEVLSGATSVSSLTLPDFTYRQPKFSPEVVENSNTYRKHPSPVERFHLCADVQSIWIDTCCTSPDTKTGTNDTNSVVAGGHNPINRTNAKNNSELRTNANKTPRLNFSTIFCFLQGEENYTDVVDPTVPILLSRPRSQRSRDDSLFDSLQDEEDVEEYTATETAAETYDTTMAFVREEHPSHRRLSAPDSTPKRKQRFRFRRTRSIPRIKSTIPMPKRERSSKREKKVTPTTGKKPLASQ